MSDSPARIPHSETKGSPREKTAGLRVLATSDLHMHLKGFDYHADRADPTVGFSRTATLIRAARAEAESRDDAVILLDNGDSLQGTPFGDWAAAQQEPHPLMRAFELLDYDAAGLGNHDFDFGLETLSDMLRYAPCPVLCSNMRMLGGAAPWSATAILERQLQVGDQDLPIRIGLLSVLPPQTLQWSAHALADRVEVSDILAEAARSVGELRQKCDLVIALAHSGLEGSAHRGGLENAVVPLAALAGIDAVIAGHTHLTLPGQDHAGLDHVAAERGLVHGKPVVMPGAAGSHLGVIDLSLTHDPVNGWEIAGATSELRPIFRRDPSGRAQRAVPEDRALTRLFSRGHLGTRRMMDVPVGRLTRPAHSYFSFCAPSHALALVAAAQAAALRGLLAGSREAELPLLSAAAPSRFGGRAGPLSYTEVAAGPVSMRNVADLYVFPNELRAVVVTGAALRDWLEMSASLFNQIAPGAGDTEAELTNPSRAGHNFDVLHGLSCAADLSRPARFHADGRLTDAAHHRIRDLSHAGQPVDPDQRFVVALNNYRANGGGNFAALDAAQHLKLPKRAVQGILRDYLSGMLPMDPLERAPQPWRFSSLGGLSAILRTGPGAARYLAEIAALSPAVLGQDADGFLRVRLTL